MVQALNEEEYGALPLGVVEMQNNNLDGHLAYYFHFGLRYNKLRKTPHLSTHSLSLSLQTLPLPLFPLLPCCRRPTAQLAATPTTPFSLLQSLTHSALLLLLSTIKAFPKPRFSL